MSLMTRRGVLAAASAVTATGLLAACGGSDGPPTIVGLAQRDERLSLLAEAVVAADLVGTLNGSGPFTVFAPTNDAFVALLGELGLTKQQLFANRPLLTAVLTYHVLPARVLRAAVPAGRAITTVQGGFFKVEAAGGGLVITDGRNRRSNIIATDVEASNGVVHLIDRVILPANRNIVETAQSLPQFSILVEAVLAANLQGALSGPGPFTVFAPTNEGADEGIGVVAQPRAQAPRRLIASRVMLAANRCRASIARPQVCVALLVDGDGRDDAHAHAQLDVGLDDVGVHRLQHDLRLQPGAGEGLVDVPRPV
jgi:uncharacterized surface protein with fasciclin (FAS1) repeats